ncbi:MAG: hypothetical protein N2035_00645 [Chthoniobacterales bacterium]|nr:hypothetical protein [Chthoniobacterales bacterium]
MNSLLLQVCARITSPLQIILSLILLLRGHNEPGGGFIGGLVAAAGIILYGFAFGFHRALCLLPLPPISFIAIGLLLAAFSGIPALLAGQPYLTGLWPNLSIPTFLAGNLKPGTPLFFDLGVYFSVFGTVLLMLETSTKNENSP